MAKSNKFQVVIDVDLPREAHERITRAIQKAVLVEIADIDVRGGYGVSLRGEEVSKAIGGGGQTDGIYIQER